MRKRGMVEGIHGRIFREDARITEVRPGVSNMSRRLLYHAIGVRRYRRREAEYVIGSIQLRLEERRLPTVLGAGLFETIVSSHARRTCSHPFLTGSIFHSPSTRSITT